MGMSTHVVGIRPPDKVWKTMKDAYDACKAAKVEVPEEILEFFNHETPDDKGVIVDLEELDCVREYSEDGKQGFEVVVRELPKDVTVIRFFNCW